MDNLNNIRLAIGKVTIFKLFLLVGIVFISIVFIWYTLDVIGQLKADAERMVTSYVRLWQLAASENSTGGEVQVIFEEVIKKANFPVIIADVHGEPVFWRNISGVIDNDPSGETMDKIRKLAAEMKEDKGEIPLMFGETVISYFYYGDSKVIKQLQWMPFVELGLVLAFIFVGLVGFQNIKRSEQRNIWVGMAKEAAHQLGTPISSLMGWLELLSGEKSGNEPESLKALSGEEDVFGQMKVDVDRLQRVANRFGQIGSIPELRETDINSILEETAGYFEKRLPFDGRGVEIKIQKGDIPPVWVNGELFTWAIENLIKNSLQAVDSQTGRIELSTMLSKNPRFIIIEVSDNGSGIPVGIARKIFRPGFTSKKRGWGLGLTLSRRIIEEYHRGKVSLLRSKPGETIFQIILPIKESDRINHFQFKMWTRRNI
jgi:hypothetical protein